MKADAVGRLVVNWPGLLATMSIDVTSGCVGWCPA